VSGEKGVLSWVKTHRQASLFGGLVIAGALYFIGVILFDNSAADAARDRAAQGYVEPTYSANQARYFEYLDSNGGETFGRETLLRAGEMTCLDWRQWVAGTHGPEGLGQQLIDMGFGGSLMYEVGVAAEEFICPADGAAYRAHLSRISSDYVDPDGGYPDPPEPPDQQWGPRG
jgi:hypothetical protein